jgi:hypothetical protein
LIPPFVVFSFPRSGSTAIHRALDLFPGVRVTLEPPFSDVLFSPSAVSRRVEEILSEYTGFKHVIDPLGYPCVAGETYRWASNATPACGSN